VRRKFFDVHAATGSPIAKETLDRIGQLYAVEKTINGSPPERRQRQRHLQSKPIAEAWQLGPNRPCASSPASPNSPLLSAICGRAGPRWCVASTTAAWRSTIWRGALPNSCPGTGSPPKPPALPLKLARSPSAYAQARPRQGVNDNRLPLILRSAPSQPGQVHGAGCRRPLGAGVAAAVSTAAARAGDAVASRSA
jgi:Transposase IS66 family